MSRRFQFSLRELGIGICLLGPAALWCRNIGVMAFILCILLPAALLVSQGVLLALVKLARRR
jgi:hypothetical protein